ncbi:twin-arginine translocation signal domain-containing protein [Candidatus Woesearchaeota archaeon]|nr:twin-arginine translocation signal domain-containing protein [Candidatus Woesearchaeota archaeon]
MDIGELTRRNFLRASGATTLLAALEGCYQIRTISIKENYPLKHTCLDNTVFIDLFDDKKECEGIFNKPITEKGYLPIFLVVKNQTQDQYVLPRNDIIFTDSNGLRWEQVTSLKMSKSFHRIPGLEAAGMGILFGILGGFTAWLGADKWNQEMDRDFTEKMMKDSLQVYPFSSANGCLYLRVPEHSKYSSRRCSDKDMIEIVTGAKLLIPLVNIAKGQKETVEVKLQPD